MFANQGCKIRFAMLAAALALLTGLLGPGALAAEQLRVSTPHRVLFEVVLPHFVAEEKGWFKDANLDIVKINTRGGGETVQIMLAGNLDIGMTGGILSIVGSVAKGAPLSIVSAEITGLPGIFWFAKGDSGIKTLADLAGKQMGFSRPGSSTNQGVLATVSMMKARGLKPAVPVPMGSPPNNYTAVMTGQLAAGWSLPPFFFKEIDEGKIRIVHRGADIASLRSQTLRVNFAHRKALKEKPAAIKSFLNIWQRSLDWIFANKEAAAELWIRGAKLKFSQAIAVKALAFYDPAVFAMWPIKGLEKTLQEAIQFKFIKKPLTAAQRKQLIVAGFAPGS